MNKSFLFLIAIVITFAICTDSVYAGGGKRNGTSGANELLIPVGARGLAMNGADVSGITGSEALYYNPAGLVGGTESAEVMFSQMSYIADISVSYAAVATKFGDLGALGFSIKSINFGDIPITTVANNNGAGTSFSPRYVTIGLSYSNNLTDHIRVGTSMKVITEKIMSTGATGFALDAGVQYSSFAGVEGLHLGVVLKNLGPQMKFDGADMLRYATESSGLRGTQRYKVDAGDFALPSLLEIGMAYETYFTSDFKGLISTTYQDNNYANDEYKIGGELAYMNMFYIRGGYSYVPQALNDDDNIYGATYGAGVNLDTGLKITVDYAYRSARLFSANHMFSVKLGF